jgi:hypothetical protein
VTTMFPADLPVEGTSHRIGDGRKFLFIASEVRCGSTFIAETIAYELKRTFGYQLFGLTKERFAHLDNTTSAEEVLETWRALHLDASGFAVAKLMCKSLSYLHRLMRNSDDIREAFFGENCFWIVVRRNDRIEQAVSLALASKTGAYHHYDDPRLASDNDAELTLAEMDWALKAVAMSDIYLQTFASSLPPERTLSVFYKDFLADEAGHLEKIHNMCGFPAFDRANYVNESKLKQTGREVKKRCVEQLRQWFLENNG